MSATAPGASRASSGLSMLLRGDQAAPVQLRAGTYVGSPKVTQVNFFSMRWYASSQLILGEPVFGDPPGGWRVGLHIMNSFKTRTCEAPR